jgi:hypothetical protein
MNYAQLQNVVYLPPIISNGGLVTTIQGFVKKSICDFMAEIDLYLNMHEDVKFLEYFHERSFLSMFLNGVVRNDKRSEVTCAQEYPVNVAGTNRRCDVWVNYAQNILIIEAKRLELGNGRLPDNHWNMNDWFEWDDKFIRQSQLLKYHSAEEESLKLPRYKSCYLMTLVFKIIRENFKDHFNEAESKLDINYHPDRDWFYSVGFISENKCEELLGVEVYGTIEKKK